MTRALVTLLALAAAPLAACGQGTSISAADYAQTCAAEPDCTPIFVGDLCSCRCDYAAINKSDLARYEAARARITCDKQCAPCQSATATCTAGRCAIK
jgi:hypothetical protein